MAALEYDLSQLEAMFKAMSPKESKRALRGAMRKAGNKVKKVAISTLASKVKMSPRLRKGIRVRVYKKILGFVVTAATPNRARNIGIPFFMEMGTKVRFHLWQRRPKATGKLKKLKKRRSTGAIKAYGYMAETKTKVTPTITKDIQDTVINHFQSIARKYGCK